MMRRPQGFDGGGDDYEPARGEPEPSGDPADSSEAWILGGNESSEDPAPPAIPEVLPGERDDLQGPTEASVNDLETRELEPLEPERNTALTRLVPLAWKREQDPLVAAKQELREAERARRRQERKERRRFSSAARRRRRNIWISVGAVVGLGVFVLAGVVTPLTAVREVEVIGTAMVSGEELEAALGRFSGTPLALVDDREVHRALEPFPLIQRYAVERIPPHTLRVRIEERLPVLSVEADDGFQLYDPAGVLIGVSAEPPAGVPLGHDRVSDVSSPAFLSAAQVLRDIPGELRAQIATASGTSGQDLAFGLSSGIQVMWGDVEHTQRKSVVLAAMLGALEGEAVELIDVSSTEAPVFQ